MNKTKLLLLVVCAMSVSMSTNVIGLLPQQKESLKLSKELLKLSAVYAGAGIGLDALGGVFHKLSGEPDYTSNYNPDSMVKKSFSRAARALSAAGAYARAPLVSLVKTREVPFKLAEGFVRVGFYGAQAMLMDVFLAAGIPFVSILYTLSLPFVAGTYVMEHVVKPTLPAIIGFGGPLLWQKMLEGSNKVE